MKKSFTRLLGLVMLLGFFSVHAALAVGIGQTKVWPVDGTAPDLAYTKTTDKLMIIYPEAVVASTGFVRLSTGGALVTVVAATDSRISYAKGDTVEIDLSGNLKELKLYSVLVDAGAFKTADDGEATSVINAWAFTTGDYTSPTLKSVVPEKGDVVDNQTAYTLVMTFEDNAAATVLKGKGHVSLYKADGNVWDLIDVASQGAMSGSAPWTLTFSGLRPLEDNVNYYVTIDAGAVTDNGLRADEKKNAYAGQMDKTVWTFSTKDFSAPEFDGDPKLANIGNTSVDVLIKANEAGKAYAAAFLTSGAQPTTVGQIKTAAIKGNVVLGAAGTEYTISLTGIGSAATSANYTVYVITENDDVKYADAILLVNVGTEWSDDFDTAENTAPKLFVGAAVSYNKGTDLKTTGTASAGNVVTTAAVVAQDIDNIVLKFDEKVKIGAGAITIRKASDNTVFKTVDASALSLVSGTGDTQVKVPVSGLGNDAKYYVQMPNTLILDVYNNAYSGMTATTAWVFTTNDVIAPAYTIVPADGASGIKVDAKIEITFDEIVYLTGSPIVVEVNNAPVTFASSPSTNDGKFSSFTLTPTNPFPSEAVVVVKILNQTTPTVDNIKDAGGNAVAIQGQGTVFVVKDVVGPVLSWDKPGGWPVKTDASATDPVVIKFDEPVYLLGGGEITDANLYTVLVLKKTDASGANVANSATISADKKTITITPSSPWVSKQQYYVAVTSDLQDASGNKYDDITDPTLRKLTFTIKDVVPATVDLSSVDGKTISTTDPVTLIFKEGTPIDARTSIYYNGVWNAYTAGPPSNLGNVIVLKEGSASGPNVAFTATSADAATFAINATLQGNKTYYVGVGASTKGSDGNVNIAKFVTFSTKEEGAPTKVSLSPADNAKEIALKEDVIITFNTDIALIASGVYNDGGSSGIGAVYLNINGGGAVVVPWTDLVVSGATLKIKHADFTANKTVEVTIDNDVVLNKNTGANPFTGIATTVWNFETIDKSFIVATIAPDNVTNAAIDDDLVLTFTEKAFIGTGNVDIINATTDAIVERINITSDQVDLSSDQLTVTITPNSELKYGVSYYIEVPEGALIDWVGNKNAAIFGKTAANGVANWTFTVFDAPITVAKTTPKNGSDKIGSNASIVIEFNREVVAGTGSVGYIEVGTPDQLQAYPIGSTNVTISGKTMTITHADKVFPDDTQIYIYLQAGAVKAKSNAAILSPLVDKTNGPVFFNTGDVNAPVATVVPGAYSVTKTYEPVETNITITFDENIYNFAGGTIVSNADVTSGTGSPLTPIFTVNDGTGNVDFIGTVIGKVVTLDPTTDLPENATITVTVKANKIKDVNGVAITGDIPFTFQTIDKTAPAVTSVTAVGAIKQIAFASTVADPNNKYLYLLIKPKSDGANPTVAEVKAGKKLDLSGTPVAGNNTFTSLLPATTYEIFYVAVDSRGNTSAVAKVEGSTTDTVAPLLVSTDPATGDVDVDVVAGEVKVKLTFNEDVQKGTGNIIIRDYATQAQLMVLDVTAGGRLVGVAGDSKSLLLTIPGVNGITTDALKFYVEIPKGAIKDVATAPNDYAGLFGVDALALTTEDNMAPEVDGGTDGDVKLDADVYVEFDENVTGGSGTLILYKGSVAGDIIPANAIQVFYASDAVFSGKKATVNPAANLVNGQDYILSAGAGFAKDLSSNANSSLADWITFTATSNPAPSVVVTPAGGATAVVLGDLTSINALFSENIFLPVAGNLKPLTLLTQAELLSNVQLVDGAGAVVPISQIVKVAADEFNIIVSSSKLHHETAYKLTISGFEDMDEQVMTTSVTNYTTSDGLAPSIVFNPAYKTKDILVNTALTLTFSEKIYANVISANDSVWANIDNTNVETFVYLRVGSTGGTDVPFTATISGKVITITPKSALESATRYYYGLKKTVEDINGQAIVLNVEEDSYVYFNTKDIKVPELGDVTAGNFAPLGDNTSPSASMWVIFNEDVLVSTGSIVIRREDGTIFQTVSGSKLTIDGTNKAKLKITHNPFEDVTNYFVELSASVVVDKSGNPNAAWSDPVEGWLFSTKETRDLQIVSLMPMGDNTARSAELKINFDKAPVATAGKYIAVYKEDGTAVHQILSSAFSISGKTASFANVALDADQAYYARIEPMAFSDAYDNNFDGLMDNTWVFSTVNNIAPEVLVLSPADNSKDVNPATDYVMTFKNDILAGTGMIAVRKSADGSLVEEVDVTTASIVGNVLTFQLSTLLADNTDYYVIVPAGAVINTEITADPFAGILNTYTWNFTTGVYTCDPVKVTATLVEQLECSAVIEIAVETAGDYVLTMNGDTITAGQMTVEAGMYDFVATTSDICDGNASLEVISVPVSRDVEVEAFLGEPAHFVDAESGIDTMLVMGVHTLVYDFEGCERTINVTVVEVMLTPTIAEIQGAADATEMEGKKVEVVATVTAVAPGEGFFMQDANAAWSGIWVEFSGATTEGIQVGNGVTVVGTVSEVANVTSIVAETVTFSPPQVAITAMALTPSEVANEMYESMLVMVDGALATAADAGSGEWTIMYAEGDDATVNDWLYDSTPVAGHYFDVKGIVNARLDNFKLEPRMESDVKDLTITKVDATAGVSFKVYPNPFNDKIYIDNNEKLVRVVISNIAGQRVIDVEYPEREIRTGTLVSGVYLVNLFTEKGLAKTERIVKR